MTTMLFKRLSKLNVVLLFRLCRAAPWSATVRAQPRLRSSWHAWSRRCAAALSRTSSRPLCRQRSSQKRRLLDSAAAAARPHPEAQGFEAADWVSPPGVCTSCGRCGRCLSLHAQHDRVHPLSCSLAAQVQHRGWCAARSPGPGEEVYVCVSCILLVLLSGASLSALARCIPTGLASVNDGA